MSDADVKRLERILQDIEGKIDKLTRKVDALAEVAENFSCEAVAMDQLNGTSRKLDEIIERLPD